MNIDSKRQSNTPDQMQFQNSLRKTQRTYLVQNSSARRNSNENEFLGSQLRKLVISLGQGNTVKCHQNIDLLFTDKNHPIHKHISFQLYVPEERSSIGLKILQNQDIWILILIYFDLIREGENAYNIKQYNQIIQQMTKYIDRDSIALVNQKVEQFHKSPENKSIKKWANQLSQSLKISQDIASTPEFQDQLQKNQKEENEFTFDQQKYDQIRQNEKIVKFSPSILNHQSMEQFNETQNQDENNQPQSDIAEFNQSADAFTSQPNDNQNISNDDKNMVDSFYQFQDSFYIENNDYVNQRIEQVQEQQKLKQQESNTNKESQRLEQQEQNYSDQQQEQQNQKEEQQQQKQQQQQQQQQQSQVEPQEQEYQQLDQQVLKEKQEQESIRYQMMENLKQEQSNQLEKGEQFNPNISENAKNSPDKSIRQLPSLKQDNFSEEIMDKGQYYLEQGTDKQNVQLFEELQLNQLQNEQIKKFSQDEVSIQIQKQQIIDSGHFYVDDNVFYPENEYFKEKNYFTTLTFTDESAQQTKQIKQEKISKNKKKNSNISQNDIHFTIQTIIDEETSQLKNKRLSSNRKKRESLNLMKNENANDLITHGSGYRYQLIQAPQSIQQKYGVKELICKKRSSKRFSYESDISSPKLSNFIIYQDNNTEGFEANNENYEDLAQKSQDILKCEGNPWRQKKQNKILRFKNSNDCEFIEEIVLIDFIDENINDNHTHNLGKILSGQLKDLICLVEIQHTQDSEIYFQDYQFYCCQLLYHYNKQDPIYVPMKCYKLSD